MTLIDNRQLTQTFQVASSFTLDKFYIDVTGLEADRSFTVSIFAVADTNAGSPNNIPSGTNLLTTTSTVTPSSISGTDGVLEIDLTGADEIALAATTGSAGYALQLDRADGTNGAFIWQTFQSGVGTSGGTVGPDLYEAGQAYGSVLGGGFSHGNSDYTPALVAIPEPSTGLLALLASSALLLRRRRA